MAHARFLAFALSPLLAFSAAAGSTEGPICAGRSGSQTAALVELYTSEGCSSCPPADRQLGELGRLVGPGAVAVPIALHVDYWDSIGWKDPFAQPAFSARHERRVQENHHSIVYTPHFFVNGQELRSGGSALDAAVHAANSRAPEASIAANVFAQSRGEIAVEVTARTVPGSGPSALFLALAQNHLVSDVTRGENRGSRLEHDHVVRAWSGPLTITDGAVQVRRAFPVPSGAEPRDIELVAFVEDTQSGAVLQALDVAHCSAPQ